MPLPIRKVLRKVYSLVMKRRTRKIILAHQEMLSALLADVGSNKTIIVFAPSLDWNTQLFQRPQQLAMALARQGALVFYIQPKPDFKQAPFNQSLPNLYLCNTLTDTFNLLVKPYVYVLTWNCDYLRLFDSPRVIYDYVDEIDVFYGDHEQIARNHKHLIREADIVLATASKLFEEVMAVRPDGIYSPNGVEYDHFQVDTEHSATPNDLKKILAEGKPIIGYYGALARWFDYPLVKKLAELRPNYNFVIIGPDYDGTLEPTGLLHIPNIHWLGVKPYAELPSYLHCFDAATIPFQVNEITHAVSPLKLFEYMAGGKPVVITPMHESMRYQGVLVASTAEEFAMQIDRALQIRNDPAYHTTIDSIARANTWDTRAHNILERMKKNSD